ncbi:carbohydrate-binding protein [Niveibacterium umoris]|uniref:CBM21 domain-containing protein n=1 Tax=Niveibacterium umoris TaxID=1193620 RepID=A0A840BGG9_9RHOO|nr:carbohydrate-binding protein [Niveibacterium umoris]MBB4010719.1 hypothetical protein [Niveibacterium umoris]
MTQVWIRIFLAVLLALPGFALAAGEVGLLKANSYISYYRGYSHIGRFEVQVANLAYEKQVSAYIKRSDGVWVDYPLSFVRATNGNKEIWAADFYSYSLPDTGSNIEFAVKYAVGGATYWDNNGGANYKLGKGAGTLLGNGVNVYGAYFSPEVVVGAGTTTWSNYTTVRNLAYAKEVKVVYTTDNWATTKVATATYSKDFWNSSYYTIPNPNVMGFEEWRYTLDIGNATQVEYAISYKVNGVTYWDNNYGRNYFSRLIR